MPYEQITAFCALATSNSPTLEHDDWELLESSTIEMRTSNSNWTSCVIRPYLNSADLFARPKAAVNVWPLSFPCAERKRIHVLLAKTQVHASKTPGGCGSEPFLLRKLACGS